MAWSASAAHLAVERVRHPDLHTGNPGLDRDQTAGVGLLDRGRIRDPLQHRQFDRLPHSQRVDHIIDPCRQVPDAGLDQLDEAGRHDRITGPMPVPVLIHDAAVSDLLLDDVAHVQDVAASELPESLSGIQIERPAQRRRQQCGGCVERQRLQIKPLEAATLPYLLHRGGQGFTVEYGQQHFGRAALHDLVHHE